MKKQDLVLLKWLNEGARPVEKWGENEFKLANAVATNFTKYDKNINNLAADLILEWVEIDEKIGKARLAIVTKIASNKKRYSENIINRASEIIIKHLIVIRKSMKKWKRDDTLWISKLISQYDKYNSKVYNLASNILTEFYIKVAMAKSKEKFGDMRDINSKKDKIKEILKSINNIQFAR